MEHAISCIRSWMAKKCLCLNDDKTEVVVIGSHSSLTKLSIPSVSIGDEVISTASHARNIGFIFDQHMNLQSQISATCKFAWVHLRNIAKIRWYLDNDSTECLIHAFITSKLDIKNSLLYGLPDTLLNRLQIIQYAAACMLTKTPKHDHITPILKQIHWLPVSQHIT